jgi:hypothetical protein
MKVDARLKAIRIHDWTQTGDRRKKPGDRRKGRVYVMGAMRYSDKKRFVEFLSKSDSISFYAVLKPFLSRVNK